jgi:HSP20 family protein
MSEDKRRYLREVLDELDRYFDEFEKTVQDSIRSSLSAGESLLRKPVVSGVALGLTPEGRPSVQFFGDRIEGRDGFRTPIYEQMLDENQETLRLIVELPGVEKDAIDISAQEEKVVVKTTQPERKYSVEVPLKNEVDPESGRATYSNGLLDVVFPIRHKTNKGYRRVNIV